MVGQNLKKDSFLVCQHSPIKNIREGKFHSWHYQITKNEMWRSIQNMKYISYIKI